VFHLGHKSTKIFDTIAGVAKNCVGVAKRKKIFCDTMKNGGGRKRTLASHLITFHITKSGNADLQRTAKFSYTLFCTWQGRWGT
jgi:hypothetical protein